MALPPLELFSLKEEATLLPGGLFLLSWRIDLDLVPYPGLDSRRAKRKTKQLII
jgi:hypothetical protein